jgi:hypothetical protein
MLRPTKPSKKKVSRKRPEKKLNASQTSLTTRRTRRQEENLDRAKAQIEELRQMRDSLLANPKARLFTALEMERYGNSRLGGVWWFLLLGLHHAEDFDDAPNDEEYEFGSYWKGHNEGSERYVLDRTRWAKPWVEEELKAAEDWIEKLEQQQW